VDKLAVGRRQIVQEAIDRFDDDAPLGKTGDGTQRVQPGLHFERHADAQLRVVFDFLAFSGSRRRTAGAATRIYVVVVRHRALRWRRTAEMRRLRCASDTCEQQDNASGNITMGETARKDPVHARVLSVRRTRARRNTLNACDLPRVPAARFRSKGGAERDVQPAGA